MISVSTFRPRIAPAAAIAAAGVALRLALATPAVFAGGAPVGGGPATLSVPATNVLDAVRALYAPVLNVSCTVRRTVSITGRDSDSGEMLSRVVWARGGRLNAQRLSPERRRTVIDGGTVWTALDGGEPMSFPVGEQLPSQRANLDSVPASPEEPLAMLDPLSARDVVPAGGGFARQVEFRSADTNQAPVAAVVSFGADGNVARIDASNPDSGGATLFTTEFAAPFEALPGVVLFRRVETTSTISGRTLKAATSYERLRVNGEIPASAFDRNAFF